jgi:hypothetical protein
MHPFFPPSRPGGERKGRNTTHHPNIYFVRAGQSAFELNPPAAAAGQPLIHDMCIALYGQGVDGGEIIVRNWRPHSPHAFGSLFATKAEAERRRALAGSFLLGLPSPVPDFPFPDEKRPILVCSSHTSFPSHLFSLT